MEGYIAQIIMFGGNFAPLGWAFCQGQMINIASNTALFSLLGTTYGGNGQTTFALPDLRSRVPVGTGQGPGLAPISLGQQGGAENTTLTTTNIPVHLHAVTAQAKVSTANATTDEPDGAVLSTGNNNLYGAVGAANGSLASGTLTLGNAGGSQPFSIRNPYLGLSLIICLQGIYPSRN
jgi:microcystin-dependent protein